MTTAPIEILLVEDNPDDEELTLLTLQENQLVKQVYVVRDGVEALEYLFAEGRYANRVPRTAPRLMLLDLKLPRLNGLQVLERVKADPYLRTMPVVVLTSSCEDRDVARCYQLGANSYIVKPVEFDAFKAAIRQLGQYWRLLNEFPSSA